MFNPYILLGALLAVITVSYFSYEAGVEAEQGREAIIARVAQAKFDEAIGKANEELRAAESAHLVASSVASSESQRLKKEANDANQKLAAAVRAGSQRVFVDSKCPTTGTSPMPQAGTDTSRPATTGATQLDAGIAEGLVAFGGKFDQLQLSYNRCYQALVDDRK